MLLAVHRLDHGMQAGAVFVGPYSPVAAGDYVAGPSHCLPTNTTARFASAIAQPVSGGVVKDGEEPRLEIGPRRELVLSASRHPVVEQALAQDTALIPMKRWGREEEMAALTSPALYALGTVTTAVQYGQTTVANTAASRVSPATTGPTPLGVPVAIRSPGNSVITCAM